MACSTKTCDVATGTCSCLPTSPPPTSGPPFVLPPSVPGALPGRRGATKRASVALREHSIDGSRRQRLLTLADNMVLTADAAGAAVTVWSVPFAMRGADRIAGVANLHYMFGASAQQLVVEAYGSNDGTTWTGAAALLTATSATPAAKGLTTSSVVHEFLRLKFQFEGTGTGVMVVSFDIHVMVGKS